MNMISWLLAASPILVVLVLMVGLRRSAMVAGASGWLAAALAALIHFGAGLDLILISQGKALLLSLDVLLIVWMALLLFQVTNEAGAVVMLGQQLTLLTADRAAQALLLAWMFTTFLNGVGGFGVPVAVIAPLLVALGFDPTAAVLMPAVGHAWSSTFGSLASAFQALIATSGLDGRELALYAGAMLALAGLGNGVSVAHIADGWNGVRRNAATLICVGIVMGGVQWALGVVGLWTIAAFSAGLAGIGAGVILARRRNALPRGALPGTGMANHNGKELALALSAYAILVTLAVIVLLVPPVNAALGHVVIRVDFPLVKTANGYITPAGPGRTISLLNHTGAILAAASLLAFAIYSIAGRYTPGARGVGIRIVSALPRRLAEPTAGIVTMVGMATIMGHAGMTNVLAEGLAHSVGAAFPFISPFIGALGAFMTGSNTNSNIVFVALQMRTASLLQLPVPLMLASQTSGAAIGSAISPAKVVVGCSSTGQTGREGIVMRAMLPHTAAILVFIGVLTFIVTR